MEITEIKIFPAKSRNNILAYANIILNDAIIIRGVTLIETDQRGRLILMPSRRLRRNRCYL